MSKISHPVLVQGYYKLISLDKIRFIIVGGVGFIVNYVILTIFYHILGLPILLSQVIGAETALLTTFVGNNFWAFTHHHQSFKKKLIKFHISALAGLLINSLIVVILVHFAHFYYGIALIVGSSVALVWNYTLYKRFVFKPHKP